MVLSAIRILWMDSAAITAQCPFQCTSMDQQLTAIWVACVLTCVLKPETRQTDYGNKCKHHAALHSWPIRGQECIP